jgi:chromate reductase, NAD(P)H dehydrogenase (quinone)
VLVYRELATIPPFNPDDDVEDRPKPEQVETLRALVGASDALIVAAPEYAHGPPGALKNALDWLVASETFAGKPIALINTSPRAFHAQASLREILSTMAARLTPEAFAAISLTGKTMTAEEILADPVCARRLTESLDALIAAMKAG